VSEVTERRLVTAAERLPRIPWLPAASALVAAILYARLPDRFVFGTHAGLASAFKALIPALIVLLLISLLVLHTPGLKIPHALRILVGRRVAIGLIALITLANAVSVILLVRFIINGGHTSGKQLVLSAIDIWWTNVIAYALWFWEIDRGGPARRAAGAGIDDADFLFPQMATRELFPKPREPTYVDYFFVAFTNAAAFSPTDTMPLTEQAKLLMLVEAGVSLLTLLMVASRAVNIL
jgi:hypothetical protein